MSGFEVPEPILNSPFEEPQRYWEIHEGEEPQALHGRRSAFYYYRPPTREQYDTPTEGPGTRIELKLVNRIRERVKAWRENRGDPYPGVTRTTRELIEWWRREGRELRLFFAQLEA